MRGNGPLGMQGMHGMPGMMPISRKEQERINFEIKAAMAREKSAKVSVIRCAKCSSQLFVKNTLVEAVAKKYPKDLDPKLPEIVVASRPIVDIYICPHCRIEVFRETLNKPTKSKEEGQANDKQKRIHAGEEFNKIPPQGSKEKQESDADSAVIRDSSGQDREMQGGIPAGDGECDKDAS